MNFRLFIYIFLAFLWMLPHPDAHAEDSIINQYDANGNLVSGDGKFYEYNDANQLMRVREKDVNGAVVGEYFYDHTGQRVKKIENSVITYYLGKYYETKVVQGQGLAQNTSYYFAYGDRVARKDSAGTYFYHPDHLGGTNAVTGSAGQLLSSTSFLPFGEIRQGGADKVSYTGKEMDNATGLYNFDARYTSPELRHFTQADIAEPDFDDPQDLNRYAYVGNNPLSYVDPDGHKKKKKAKLSKREKWMIAHGVDPDHDKTSLKKAKKLEKAGKKYAVAAKSSSYAYKSASAGTIQSNNSVQADAGFCSDPVSVLRLNMNRAAQISQQRSDSKIQTGPHGWSRVLSGSVGLVGGSISSILSGTEAVKTLDATKAARSFLSLGAAVYSLGEIMAGEKELVVRYQFGEEVEIDNDLDKLIFFSEIDDAFSFGGL